MTSWQTQVAISALFPVAWKKLWASNLRERERQKNPKWAGRTYYLTAANIEREVREMVGYRVRISGNLKEAVRAWLLNEVSVGRLQSHNFGRGHVSGMRFRPSGEPMGEAELLTMVTKKRKKDRPRVVHFSRHYGGRALCVVESAKAKGRRLYGWRRSKAQTSTRPENVTCVRCQNLAMRCEEVA